MTTPIDNELDLLRVDVKLAPEGPSRNDYRDAEVTGHRT
jgi:hypothetical protein